MSKYVNGYRVIKELDIEGFELVELAKEGKIQPFSKNGSRICDIRIKKEIENQDNCVLYLKRLELGSFAAGLVMTNKGNNHNSMTAIEKARLESEIKALEKKGAVPLSFDQVLPREYTNCIWESFEVPKNEKQAEKVIQRFIGFLYLKSEVDELKTDQFQDTEGDGKDPVQETAEEGYASEQNEGERSSAKETVEAIKVCYENEREFKIKFPGKPFRPCTYNDLGCRNEDNDDFKFLLDAIKDGSFYSNNRSAQVTFERGCRKLTKYIRERHIPSLPEKFKIYEKDDSSTYRLILQIQKDSHAESKYEKMPAQELVSLLKQEHEKPAPVTVKNYEAWQRNKEKIITEIATAALAKGVSQEEIMEIIEPDSLKDIYNHETRERKTDSIAWASIPDEPDYEDY